MSSYTISKQLTVTVPVSRKSDGVLVDPATFLFTMKPPVDGGYASTTYAWNGTVWTNVDPIGLAVPSRVSLGTFRLTVSTPHANIAAGTWFVDWFHQANLAGDGQGGDHTSFVLTASGALP